MTMKNTANSGRGQTHPKESLGIINSNDFSSLVPVISGQIGGRESNIVSAKALHKALGVGRDFSTWFNERMQEYGFVRGADYFIDDDQSAAWLVNEQYSPFRGKIKSVAVQRKTTIPP